MIFSDHRKDKCQLYFQTFASVCIPCYTVPMKTNSLVSRFNLIEFETKLWGRYRKFTNSHGFHSFPAAHFYTHVHSSLSMALNFVPNKISTMLSVPEKGQHIIWFTNLNYTVTVQHHFWCTYGTRLPREKSIYCWFT